MHSSHQVLLSCGWLALFGVNPVLAQSAQPVANGVATGTRLQNQAQGVSGPNEPADSRQLEEIIVTAEKREEGAQHVPAVVLAVSQDTLSRAGIRDFADLNKALPDVQIDDIVGATNITIRGVRESSAGPTSDSPTAVHLDGIYIPRATGLNGMFYDLARIEELPGPQGTLYGRNATGGVINLIANKPTDEFGGNVEVEMGNIGLYRVSGAINLPVTADFALRGAVHILHNDGYISGGFNNTDQKGGRLTARWNISPDVTLQMGADIESAKTKGPAQVLVANTYPSLGGPPTVAPAPSDPFRLNPVLYPLGALSSSENDETYGAMTQLDYDLGFATLTAEFGVRKLILNTNQLNLGQVPEPVPITTVGTATTPAYSTSYSGEVRLASSSKVPLQWVGGLYYFNEKNGGTFCLHGDVNDPTCVIEIANPFQRTRAYAVFGQGVYTPPILDQKLHLTLGGRYNDEHKNAAAFTTAVFANQGAGGYLDNEPNLHATFSSTNYKAEVSYDVTPDSLIYALNATGFRAGGFAYGLTPEYKPETIMAEEIGSKNRLLDNSLQVNVAAYHYIYRNQETNVTSPPPPGIPIPFSDLSVQSIGEAEYYGVGLDLEYAVTLNDRVATNIQYENAKYVRFVIPPAYVTSQPIGLNGVPTGEPPGSQTGLQVRTVAPWVGNFSYDHTLPAFSGKLDGRAALQFSDKVPYLAYPKDTIQYKYGTAPAYARIDLSLSFAPDSGSWKATAYVNNVGNKAAFTGNNYENAFNSGQVTATLLPPREYGIILSAKF